MFELTIDRLRLQIIDGAGHEHRVEPIATRAVALLGDRILALSDVAGDALADRRDEQFQAVSIPPVSLDLGRMSDQEAAERLAEAMEVTIKARLGMM
jgi:hypothetical protein